MKMKKPAGAALFAIAVLLLAPATAAADPNPGGSVTSAAVTVQVTVSTAGGDVPIDEAVASSAPLLTWKVFSDETRESGLSGLCLANNDPTHPKYGWQYRILGIDASGKVVVDTLECVPFATNNDKPPPPSLPQLPTVGEAWASAELPPPSTTIDPPRRGVTGLDTRIHTTGPHAVTISATIRGYTITGTASAIGHVIGVDGTALTTGEHAHLMFATKGIHTIEVATRWHATATLTGAALIRPVTIDLGTATVTVRVEYPVIEIRSILQA
jgi:hypothetical protein